MKFLLIAVLGAAFFAGCRQHPYAVCNYVGVGQGGTSKYHCTCGDDIYE